MHLELHCHPPSFLSHVQLRGAPPQKTEKPIRPDPTDSLSLHAPTKSDPNKPQESPANKRCHMSQRKSRPRSRRYSRLRSRYSHWYARLPAWASLPNPPLHPSYVHFTRSRWGYIRRGHRIPSSRPHHPLALLGRTAEGGGNAGHSRNVAPPSSRHQPHTYTL